MSRRSLTELLSEDSAYDLILKSVEDSNKEIKRFTASELESAASDEKKWREASNKKGDDDDDDDDDDEWATGSDNDNDDCASKTAAVAAASAAGKKGKRPIAGQHHFENVTHRLIPICRNKSSTPISSNSVSAKNDGGEEQNDAATTTETTAAAAVDPGAEQLLQLQVTTRSTLGSIAFFTHQLLCYNGIVKVLGAGRTTTTTSSSSSSSAADGAKRTTTVVFHSISSLTALLKAYLPAGCVAVAHDVFGGIFVMNSGSIAQSKPGNICYLPPDSTQFECLGVTYTAWLTEWLMNPSRVWLFYSSWLFDGIARAAITELSATQAFSFVPPLWTKEARTADVSSLSRRAVPLEELVGLRLAIGGSAVAPEAAVREARNDDGGEHLQK